VSEPGRAVPNDAVRPRRPSLSFPDDNAPLYTVGQVAEMLGVQAAFLRRLDSEQLVSPGRSPGGQRRYSRLEIDHIDAINGLLDEHMTLAGAKRIIALQADVAALQQKLAAYETTCTPEPTSSADLKSVPSQDDPTSDGRP